MIWIKETPASGNNAGYWRSTAEVKDTSTRLAKVGDHVAEEHSVEELRPVRSHMLQLWSILDENTKVKSQNPMMTDLFGYRRPAGQVSLGVVGVDRLVHATKLFRFMAWHIFTRTNT